MTFPTVLSMEEYALKSRMKRLGILKRFKPEEIKGIARNGGVAIWCGDGDVDMRSHHKRAVSHRPHCSANFGGPLLFVPAFAGYDPCYAKSIFENIREGMGAKKTKTVFAYFHYPCAMAIKHKHGLAEVFGMIPAAVGILKKEGFERIHILFHAKRLNVHKQEEQNTYIVDVELLVRFHAEGGLNKTEK